MSEWPETREATTHDVLAGDHLARIAALRGFRSYLPIWNHGENARLRQLRGTPHVLAPGDQVYVPAVRQREARRATEQRYRFEVTLPVLELRVARRHWDGSPMDTPPDAVALDGRAAEHAMRGGAVTVTLAPLDTTCVLQSGDESVTLRIGHLAPVSTVAGYRERLNNLGYRAGDAEDPRDRAIRSAVEEFQCDEGLTVDGTCGPVTQQLLRKVHGC